MFEKKRVCRSELWRNSYLEIFQEGWGEIIEEFILRKKNLKGGETYGEITCILKISKWFWGIQGVKLVFRKCISD
jgi:hypothetical protein